MQGADSARVSLQPDSEDQPGCTPKSEELSTSWTVVRGTVGQTIVFCRLSSVAKASEASGSPLSPFLSPSSVELPLSSVEVPAPGVEGKGVEYLSRVQNHDPLPGHRDFMGGGLFQADEMAGYLIGHIADGLRQGGIGVQFGHLRCRLQGVVEKDRDVLRREHSRASFRMKSNTQRGVVVPPPYNPYNQGGVSYGKRFTVARPVGAVAAGRACPRHIR